MTNDNESLRDKFLKAGDLITDTVSRGGSYSDAMQLKRVTELLGTPLNSDENYLDAIDGMHLGQQNTDIEPLVQNSNFERDKRKSQIDSEVKGLDAKEKRKKKKISIIGLLFNFIFKIIKFFLKGVLGLIIIYLLLMFFFKK